MLEYICRGMAATFRQSLQKYSKEEKQFVIPEICWKMYPVTAAMISTELNKWNKLSFKIENTIIMRAVNYLSYRNWTF